MEPIYESEEIEFRRQATKRLKKKRSHTLKRKKSNRTISSTITLNQSFNFLGDEIIFQLNSDELIKKMLHEETNICLYLHLHNKKFFKCCQYKTNDSVKLIVRNLQKIIDNFTKNTINDNPGRVQKIYLNIADQTHINDNSMREFCDLLASFNNLTELALDFCHSGISNKTLDALSESIPTFAELQTLIRTSTTFESINNLINAIKSSKAIYLDELTKFTFYFEKCNLSQNEGNEIVESISKIPSKISKTVLFEPKSLCLIF